jgi:plasmid stability protein
MRESITQTRDKLKDVNTGRNLTIHLPEQLIRRLRVCAATRNQSMTAVVKEAIERILVEDGVRDAAASRLIRRLQNAPDRGIGGKISWTRDELHDR